MFNMSNNTSIDICNHNVFSEQRASSENKQTNDVTIELKEKLISENTNNVNNKSTANLDQVTQRDVWTNKIEYMLSVIGYVVDLGNCVRFPYVAYKNGGGAFLIPYFVFLFLVGVPMMYLEMTVGQYFQVGNICLWGKVNKYMKGIGYGSLLVVCYITLYYATIIAYSVFYLFASFRSEMPWSRCDNPWNTKSCRVRSKNIDLYQNNTYSNVSYSNQDLNQSLITTPSEEYFSRYMLGIHKSTGLDDLGPIKLDLTFCLATVYFLMYICICNGVKSTGKAVYVTAVLPYIILIFLLVHGLTLEGSFNGVYYFLVPVYTKLLDYQCWKDAAIQIFFTLGPGISVLTTYASYSKFNNNCQIDAIAASIANVIASFLAGIVVFSSLGYLSLQVNKSIDDVVNSDLGLSFVAYPELLSTLKYPAFYSIIFFLMIINLGLDSGFGGIEAIYTALADEFKFVKNYRKTAMAIIHVVLFIGSLPTVTYGGNYLVTFLDTFSTSPALMLIVFAEAISVCYLYGIDRFKENIHDMFQVRPNLFWRICWKYVGPTVIFFLFLISIFFFEAPPVGDYVFPKRFLVIGWLINISIMIPIPLMALRMCYKVRTTRMKTPKLELNSETLTNSN